MAEFLGFEHASENTDALWCERDALPGHGGGYFSFHSAINEPVSGTHAPTSKPAIPCMGMNLGSPTLLRDTAAQVVVDDVEAARTLSLVMQAQGV